MNPSGPETKNWKVRNKQAAAYLNKIEKKI
jgi:hypothetical protein